ncbi:MAG TPA: DUF3106 domain-containing protein [Bryobacteraceae bacterium]|nr:DUF3106 domain-containing protein [Bryobacteraceae bacterium]
MGRILQIGGLLLLLAATGICDQNKAAPKKEAPPRKGGAGVAPKQGPRLANPASPAARLYRATPDERDRAIEQLPPAQQERVRNQLRYFDSLPKNQQDIMIARTERLNSMPPEKRRAFQLQLQNLNRLPPERRQAVAGALRRLQVMPEERRIQVLNSEQFKRMYSPEEQKMIADLSEVMLPPM